MLLFVPNLSRLTFEKTYELSLFQKFWQIEFEVNAGLRCTDEKSWIGFKSEVRIVIWFVRINSQESARIESIWKNASICCRFIHIDCQSIATLNVYQGNLKKLLNLC